MAFTYLGDLSTDLDKVRFHIGDVQEDSGPRPDDRNFTDAELNGLITLEGNWRCATAAAFEALAGEWQAHPVFGVSELGTQHARVAEGFVTQAATWRQRCIDYQQDNQLGSIAGVATVTREDSYS